MRLLRLEEDGEFSLVEYVGREFPKYAILSHTWGESHDEVTLLDLMEGTGKEKAGYYKLTFCAKQAAHDGLQFFWMDTCCIDKSSSADVSEAINSMFRWYSNSAKCYVYLSDVATGGFCNNDKTFQRSRWFTRGWTLQELLAPRNVEFFSIGGDRLGDRVSLVAQIAEASGISLRALQGSHLSDFSVDERMSWARRRETKREEDMAYSLLGIFDIHMTPRYGEGQKALDRLQKKIEKSIQETPTFLSIVLSAETTETALVKKFEGNNSGEVSWMNVLERWKQHGRCYNCGSGDHWMDQCLEKCGKCLHWGHKSSRCGYPVRCKRCSQQGHMARQCPN